ncbi:MAG: DUF2092 domain-containing protein [Phycisphaerales bacterium]|nr:DUF2092 domain-containing protein [Phycisphaerales bacterium]
MIAFRRALVLTCLSCLCAAPTYAQDEPDGDPLEGYSKSAVAVLKRMIEGLKEVKTYSDQGVITMKTDAMFGAAGQEQKMPFSFMRERKFRMETQTHTLVSDGKELHVLLKAANRYQTTPLKDDLPDQLEEYFGGMGLKFGTGQLLLSRKPAKLFTEVFKELDRTGEEDVDGDGCHVLEGKMNEDAIPIVSSDTPVRLMLRKSDGLLRRVEIDLSEAMKKQMEQAGGMMQVSEFKVIYDVKDIKINERPDENAFAFEAPSSAKKVDKFYSSGMGGGGDTAQQFELSGHEAPAFELEAHGGGHVSLESLRGRITVLYFGFPRFGGNNQDTGLAKLDDVQREYADKDVAVVCIHPSPKADSLVESLGREPSLTIVLDPDRSVAGEYFDEAWAMGIVLVGKDGVVQGRYSGFFNEMTGKSLRKDLDKLVAGEALPAAEKMTDEQKDEAFEQRSASMGMGTSEPLNEDRLKEAWSVRASAGNMSFSSGGSKYDDKVFWVRDKGAILGISPSGEKVIELPLLKKTADPLGQESFAVGKLGKDWAVVYLSTIAGEEQQAGGWRPPKGAVLTATNQAGEELWKLELEVKNFQVPQHLALADVDGRPGDEVVYFHDGAICILDSRGEAIVKKPSGGWAQWLIAADRDQDNRAEIYLRTQYKLTRYDYAK